MNTIENDPVSAICVVLDGELTIRTVCEVKDAWMAILADEGGIRVDLSAVSAMDVAGLQLLLAMRAYAEREGKLCELTGLTPSLYQVIGLLNLNSQLLDE